MRSIILIFTLLAWGLAMNAQVNQMKIGKGGITFQDGEVMNSSVSPSRSLIP